MDILCPCHSKKTYAACCQKFHEGDLPTTAVELMRSRYAAYALQKADYIMQTTHQDNPAFQKDTQQWKKQIEEFCQNTIFKDLQILSHTEDEKQGIVVFKAYLQQKGKDISFTEKSFFEKCREKWLYKTGQILA